MLIPVACGNGPFWLQYNQTMEGGVMMLEDNLKRLRTQSGISQEELAIRLNVVRQTVSKWERGLSVPDADMLIRIAEIFEVNVSQLLGQRVETEKDRDELAVQLMRINEQLATRNRRVRRIWRGILITLVAVFAISFIMAILNVYVPGSPGRQASTECLIEND